jgi:DNA repair protein SbcC/Rad50
VHLGADHGEYGRMLGVPPLRPGGHPGGVHLWHLIEDPDELFGLLAMGVETWGMLEALVRHGAGGDGTAAALHERAAPRARMLARILDLARIGRGRPVDGTVLRASGAVSDTFMDRALALCRELDGDAARLVEAIDGRALRGFRRDNAGKLRAYLEAEGYLDVRARLEADAIRVRVLAELDPAAGAGAPDSAALDRMLANLQLA